MATKIHDIPSSGLLGYIKTHREQADEVVYWFIHVKMAPQLKDRYMLFASYISDEYADVENDFFMYLRNGKNGGCQVPFKILESVKQKTAFEVWLLSTFRNYLTNRSAKGVTTYEIKKDLTDYDSIEENSDVSLSDEQKIQLSAKLIAYTHQLADSRERYILLRTILTILDKQRALPDEEIATALGITYTNYRVIVHRIKDNMKKAYKRLLKGEELPLDQDHQAMAMSIDNDFDNLYPTILLYYNDCIQALRQASRIQAIRLRNFKKSGFMLHDHDSFMIHTPNVFWKTFKVMLIGA